MKICIVVSNYYKEISNNLLRGTINELNRNGYKNVKIKFVSGAFEIPGIISRNIKKFNAFIALGCVIKGQTDHYYFISQAVTSALITISVNSKKPVGNGIITCLNKKQAKERKKKGAEAAEAIMSVLAQK